MWERNNCRHPSHWRRKGRKCSRCQRFPCSLWHRPRWSICAPAAHGGSWGSVETPARAGGCLKKAVTLVEAHTGTGSWKNLWTHGKSSLQWSRFAGRAFGPTGDPRWSSPFLKDCALRKGSMLEQFVKKCSLWEGFILEKFMKDCLLWEGSHGGAGEECESSSWGGRNSKD